MSGLIQITNALATNLADVYADTDPPLQISAVYLMNPSPPTIDIYPGRTPARDGELAGFEDVDGAYLLTVRARIGTADADASQEILYELLDDESDFSLQSALLEDPTLGGHASSIDVVSSSGFTIYPDTSGVGKWLGFDLELRILAAYS